MGKAPDPSGPDHVEPGSDPLVAYSKGMITRHAAIEALGLRDYAELLVRLGDADLPMPLPPEEEIERQAELFVRLMKGT